MLRFSLLSSLYILIAFLLFSSCINKKEKSNQAIAENAIDSLAMSDMQLADTTPIDTLVVEVRKPIAIPQKPLEVVKIEDYGVAAEVNRGMLPFYHALTNSHNLNRPIRIAFLGDSFIEGDILTADFRAMLQKQFGGCGVGFVPITSETNGFRPTVTHNFDGWSTYAYTDKDKSRQDKRKIGLTGSYFEPTSNASVQLRGVKRYASRLDTCDQVTFFLKSQSPIELGVKINGGNESDILLAQSSRLQAKSVNGRIGTLDLEVEKGDSTTTFYGVAMDGKDGVVVDNYSMRGSTGLFLCTVPYSFMEEFNAVRPYDLIVLQYGLNVLSNNSTDYKGYEQRMITAVERLKKGFPQAGILVMSIGDRAFKDQNTQQMFTASESINALLQSQRNIAKSAGVAFWNVFEVMGGDGGIDNMVNSTPALANKDYTHINFQGGRFIAKQLYNALIDGMHQSNL